MNVRVLSQGQESLRLIEGDFSFVLDIDHDISLEHRASVDYRDVDPDEWLIGYMREDDRKIPVLRFCHVLGYRTENWERLIVFHKGPRKSALAVQQAQRLPVPHEIEFQRFRPVGYVAECGALITGVNLSKRSREFRLDSTALLHCLKSATRDFGDRS